MDTCYLSANTYIENICDKIEKAIDVKLRNYQMPIDPDYRPEIDNSIVMSEDLIAKYRMLVGPLRWVDMTFCTQPVHSPGIISYLEKAI